jgi:hypothetical protein
MTCGGDNPNQLLIVTHSYTTPAHTLTRTSNHIHTHTHTLGSVSFLSENHNYSGMGVLLVSFQFGTMTSQRYGVAKLGNDSDAEFTEKDRIRNIDTDSLLKGIGFPQL